jgi:hypothetical protein
MVKNLSTFTMCVKFVKSYCHLRSLKLVIKNTIALKFTMGMAQFGSSCMKALDQLMLCMLPRC